MDFDFESINTRLIQDLQKRSGNTDILFYSVNNYLLSTLAAGITEIALYDEYLTRECKWDTAMNMSSLMAEAKFRNYKPKRKQSAIGDLLASVNQDIITKDFYNNDVVYSTGDKVVYNSAAIDEVPRYGLYSAAVNAPVSAPADHVTSSDWTYISTKPAHTITIPKWTKFASPSKTVVAVDQFNILTTDDYIVVNVCEGTPASSTFTAAGTDFESFIVTDSAIENSHYELTVDGVTWTEVDDLYAEGSTDMVYSVDTKNDFTGITINFGNDVFGKKLSAGMTVKFYYVVSTGSTGNILQAKSITSVTGNLYDDQVPPVVTPVYCTNLDAVSGGAEHETLETLRRDAITSFQTQKRAVTYNDYKSILETLPYISKVAIWGAYEYLVDNGLSLDTYIPFEENVIHITGFGSTGQALTPAQEDAAIIYLQDFKSPTDLVSFETAEFIGLAFNIAAYVSDRSLSLASVKADIINKVTSRYNYLNMEFKESLYDTVWESYLQTNITGLSYHVSYIDLVQYFTFNSAWTATVNVSVHPDSGGSMELWIKSGSGNYVLLATDQPDSLGAATGKYVGYTGHGSGLPGSTSTGFTISPLSIVNYTSGETTVVVTAGLPISGGSASYSDYTIKAYYRPATENIILDSRTQILEFEEMRTLSAQYVS